VIVDSSYAILVLLFAYAFWSTFGESPVWVTLYNFFLSVTYLFLGISLALGNSLHQPVVVDLRGLFGNNEVDDDKILRWINKRMPDPKEQRALQETLNKTYGSSPTRWIGKTMLFLGGIFILKPLNAAYNWVIAQALNNQGFAEFLKSLGISI
jgi:hypothetical protein